MVGSASLTCLAGDRSMKDPGCLLQDVIQLMWAALLLVILRVLVDHVLMAGASKNRFSWCMLEFVD
jgi:hypothetical protein